MVLQPTTRYFLPPVIISVEEFEGRFADADKIATDECSGNDNITSFEVGDCITLFGRERLNGRIQAIFACHFDSLSDKEEIREEMEGFMKQDQGVSYRFCIVGGNGSPDSNKCARQIEKVANALAREGYEIKSLNKYLNLNQGMNLDYIDVNIRLRNRLVLCRY